MIAEQFMDWDQFNKGLNVREMVRFVNGKFNPCLTTETYSCGYEKGEWLDTIEQYAKENEKKISRRRQRSEQLKQNNEKNKQVK